jgi:hypothetical protein
MPNSTESPNPTPQNSPEGIELKLKISEKVAQELIQGIQRTVVALLKVLLPLLLSSYSPMPTNCHHPSNACVQIPTEEVHPQIEMKE